MKSLEEIFREGNSDKCALHQYHTVYEELFTPFRLKPIRLLELGFLSGDSLEAWAKFLPNGKAEIYGMDLLDWLYRPTDSRIKLFFGDCGKPEVLQQTTGNFTVIIDDAGHFSSQQINTFTEMWPRVEPGGLYIIEDLHSVHSPVLSDGPYTIIEYMSKLATEMQDERGAEGSAAYDPNNRRADIESIEIRRGLAIIRKRI